MKGLERKVAERSAALEYNKRSGSHLQQALAVKQNHAQSLMVVYLLNTSKGYFNSYKYLLRYLFSERKTDIVINALKVTVI